jgi:hypothetical protein
MKKSSSEMFINPQVVLHLLAEGRVHSTCGAPGILFRYFELAQPTGEKSGP